MRFFSIVFRKLVSLLSSPVPSVSPLTTAVLTTPRSRSLPTLTVSRTTRPASSSSPARAASSRSSTPPPTRSTLPRLLLPPRARPRATPLTSALPSPSPTSLLRRPSPRSSVTACPRVRRLPTDTSVTLAARLVCKVSERSVLVSRLRRLLLPRNKHDSQLMMIGSFFKSRIISVLWHGVVSFIKPFVGKKKNLCSEPLSEFK